MTLRLRLVLATVALVAAGLVAFGLVTTTLYSSSQYSQLDATLRSSVPPVERLLEYRAGLQEGPQPGDAYRGGPSGGPGGGPGDGGGRGEPTLAPPGTFGQLRSGTTVLASLQLIAASSPPRLPSPLPAPAGGVRFLTVGSDDGSGQYRVAVAAAIDGSGNTVVVAVPESGVRGAVRRLELIEGLGALALLALLSAGSWLLLRRGLQPLERMAGTARSITAGDLSQRVGTGGPSEVGQLGLALNTMLGDLEAAFAEREETERRLRQFLADASHELRTPLTSIRGFAELFRLHGAQARVDLPTILRRIEEESARMAVLVEDLLTLARLDRPRAPAVEPVDLAVLAADACSDALAHAPDRSVTLDAPAPVVVAGDEAHLRQAIANLVTNALRHTPPGTPVQVAARVADGRAVVEVRDHGPGLSEEALAHAFDRFWQADAARVGAGSGLGLSIVAGIAAEHGGRAGAANAPDGGAVFTLSLPIGRVGTPAGVG